jgi:hypothetical protein
METNTKPLTTEHLREAKRCLDSNEPFLYLLWLSGDWAIYKRQLIFNYNYYVCHKGEIVRHANDLMSGIEWVMQQEEYNSDDSNK